MATVKELGSNDEGILEFYTDYFNRHAIYMDEKWQVYRAMGGKDVSVFKLLQRLAAAHFRYTKKNIKHSAGNANPKAAAAGWMQGGILIFNRRGELTFALEEDVGRELDMDAIEFAIDEARMLSSSDSDDTESSDLGRSSGSLHFNMDASSKHMDASSRHMDKNKKR